MKHLARILWLSALVLLCGCGVAGYKGAGGPGGATGSGLPVPGSPDPTPHGLNIVSNWQFTTASTVPGTPALTIAGSISQSGGTVSGAVHVDGSSCFDRLATMGLTGTMTGGNVSVTSTSVAGQVVTFTGSIANSAFTGTYTINGGCANGDQGNVTGIEIGYLANILNGTFSTSGGGKFDVAGNMAQNGNPGPEGSFGVTGTVTFTTPCFSSGTITPGAFPSGSFIMGTSVALEIETGNGTVAFLGTLNPDTAEISGDYTVVGGTCDQSGTALLVGSSPWDY